MAAKNSRKVVLLIAILATVGFNYGLYRKLSARGNYDRLSLTLQAASGDSVPVRSVFPAQKRAILFLRVANDHAQRAVQALERQQSIPKYLVQEQTDLNQPRVTTTMPLYRDSGIVASTLQITRFPCLMLVDEKGKVRKIKYGEPSDSYLSRVLDDFQKGIVQNDPVLESGRRPAPFQGKMPDGKIVQLPLRTGAILVFSEQGCKYCDRQWSEMEQVLDKATLPVYVVVPGTDQPGATERPNLPTIFVDSYSPFEEYGIQIVPSIVWLDENGTITNFHTGYLGQQRLAQMLGQKDGVPLGPLLNQGDKIPRFTLADANGARWTEEVLRGKTTALIFGNTRCPGCRDLQKYLSELKPGPAADSLLFVYTDAASVLHERASAEGRRYLVDDAGIVSSDFGVEQTPTILVVSPDLTMSRIVVGFDRQEIKTLFESFESAASLGHAR